MMCLGWKTKQTCPTRGHVQLDTALATCPSITWFWLALGAIGLGAITQGSKKTA